jgi:hypothetical protein
MWAQHFRIYKRWHCSYHPIEFVFIMFPFFFFWWLWLFNGVWFR